MPREGLGGKTEEYYVDDSELIEGVGVDARLEGG